MSDMANDLTAKSSLEASIKEAQRFGASPDEARQIHDLVRANAASGIVKNFELKFGPDSTNNRAVWVLLVVDKDLSPSQEKISELNRVASNVRSALLRANLAFWPYVDIRSRDIRGRA